MTKTLSAPMIVLMRCAIVTVVKWFTLTSWRRTSWMRLSVRKSTLAVASSKIRIRDFRKMALAAQTSCIWPTDKLSPPAVILKPKPSSFNRKNSASCTSSSVSHNSASVRSLKGSRLNCSEPVKPTGSCGMIARRRLKTWRPRVEVSTPSMKMQPPSKGHIRKSACNNELFPAPVRPTTPKLVPPGTAKEMPFRTDGRSAR
mmetsp:Transcript_119214/g.344841  ORF Transcript_119214/g.344841 Transcript_119214/m.344841 type:complete len:201 (-) Transcript_119214:1183-1785(-)